MLLEKTWQVLETGVSFSGQNFWQLCKNTAFIIKYNLSMKNIHWISSSGYVFKNIIFIYFERMIESAFGLA